MIFALSVTAFIGVLWVICAVVHGRRRLNFLTLRPWRIAFASLFITSIKAISNEVYMSWDLWLLIERICKLFNIYFGMTLVLEKEILCLFMVYQAHFDLSQHDVMKDKFRSLERRLNRTYWNNMLVFTVFVVLSLVLSFSVDNDTNAFLISKALINLALMSLQVIVLSMYSGSVWTFLNLMKKHHRYEYERHQMREKLTFALITVSFMFLDLLNLIIYSSDIINLWCYSFIESMDTLEIDENSICNWIIPDMACYYKLTPIFCTAYALPMLFFVFVARPHDCFGCLSVCPENRISNFQYTIDDLERR